MIGWTDDANHFEKLSQESVENVIEPEPPARCQSCGGSLWIVDRDADGLCDECWVKAEKIKLSEYEAEQRESAKRIAAGGELG